jgi:carboxyl-terminal processing protease
MRIQKRSWALAIPVLATLIFSGAHTPQSVAGQDGDSRAGEKIVDSFTNALTVARSHYAGEIDSERVTKSSILGMLHTLDPHSSYLDPKEWQEFQSQQQSHYSGIGSTIIPHNGKVYILSPFDGTPSYRAGIRYGDQIIEIDGQSTEGWTSVQVTNKLLGPEGTPVAVKISRIGVDHPLEYKLVRASVPLPSIASYFMVGKGIGYIDLQRGFNTTTSDEMSRALKDLREQGMTSLILDLRSNRGGLVDQAWRVTNEFLYRGQKIVSMRGRAPFFPDRDLAASNTSPDDMPVVVLINGGSASAAEIVAGALQDHDRARLVGEGSFGKGLVQNVFPLKDGSGLLLTTGKYYTPSGRLIQRDYTNRSFYDYYLQRGDKEALQVHRPEAKHTDSGRVVYGGDGIQPDVAIKIPLRIFRLNRVWTDSAFAFARDLVAGTIPGFTEFKVSGPADHKHRFDSSEYRVDDKVLAAFKEYLKQHSELKADRPNLDKDSEVVKDLIRQEVVTAAYGQETARAVFLESDVQMRKALAELPNAKGMADDIRRVWAASRNGDYRRN